MDTLRAALPMKWFVVLREVMRCLFFVVAFWRGNLASFLHTALGLSRDFSETAPLFIEFSSVAASFFLGYLTRPYVVEQRLRKRRAREYSRRHKMTEEHEKILERWKREVKPEGDSQNRQ